jgi:hypothetical protein
MCADFVSPTPSFAPQPDILAAYLRGQNAPILQAGAMQELQQGQQDLQTGALKLDQLRGSISALLSGGDPNKPLSDAQALISAQRNDQLQRIKLRNAPIETQINDVLTSPNPAYQSYNNVWQNYAPKITGANGRPLDPYDPANKAGETGALNIKTAAAMALNDLRAQYGGEQVPMPYNMQNVRGANGQ